MKTDAEKAIEILQNMIDHPNCMRCGEELEGADRCPVCFEYQKVKP